MGCAALLHQQLQVGHAQEGKILQPSIEVEIQGSGFSKLLVHLEVNVIEIHRRVFLNDV